MDPAQCLREEHHLIGRVLGALETYVAEVEARADENRHDLVLLVTFFREFADLVHHEKEEGLVLPALVYAGMPWDDGALREIRRQHDLERYLTRSLRHAALQGREWSSEDRRHLIEVAHVFIDFMRRHISLEDGALLPAIDQRLDAGARAELASSMQRFDERWRDGGEAAAITRLATELVRRYPPGARREAASDA